ncbi:MAG TPA: hypothetical protein VN667_02800 [Burkholderiales bacterium]|nr:hypothetical protein [Burkholderiales bacterium]
MTPDKPTGKTPWDVLAEVTKSPWLFVAVGVFFGALFLATHSSAKPGTEVNLLWGLVKYQKSDLVPPSSPSIVTDSTKGYVLPKNEETHQASGYNSPFVAVTHPILDKGINFVANGYDLTIGGANIKQISVAARSSEGDALSMTKKQDGSIEIKQGVSMTHIELSYKGNFFSLVVGYSKGRLGNFTVEQIPSTTLTLSPYAAI